MATLNTATTEQAATAKKSPTHFINVNVNASGKLIKLGAIPIFENADKAQRTLLDMVAKFAADPTNPKNDVRTLDIIIDVRANEKSTDTYNADDWSMVDRQFEEVPAE